MTTMVFIIPADLRDNGDGMAEAMGWGRPVFVQPLSATGEPPVTHWGFPAHVSDSILSPMANPPAEWAELIAQIVTDAREGTDTGTHWREALAAWGLAVVPLAEDNDS